MYRRRRIPRWRVTVAPHVLDRRLLIEPQTLEVSAADERDARAEATRAVLALTASGAASESYTNAAQCGVPQGKKQIIKPVTKGTFTGSAVALF